MGALEKARAAAALAAFWICCGIAAGEPHRAVVAAAHPRAVEAGVAALKLGGSAVDAAIAAQLVLNVVEPQSSGIGGGAFLLVWTENEKKIRSYDGRETAPARAGRFPESAASGLAVGVPGLLRVLELAHRRHGRLRWAELFQRAIFAAEEGFEMAPRLQLLLERESELRNVAEARRLYYQDDDKAKRAGTLLRNPALGETLREVALKGAGAFYSGAIAADIVRAVREHRRPGDLSLEDLAAYRALERAPLCGAYRAHRVCGMAPPSSGGVTLLQLLGILERAGFGRAPPNSAEAVHLFAEAARLAYADRARYVADPAFVKVPLGALLSPAYLDARAGLIGERAMATAPAGEPQGGGTSHISIVDARGNAVAMTSSIESSFGSRILVRGFLLNNQLTDFSAGPGSANRLEPGKRPRSSMAPTLVFGPNGRLRMALGSAGGPPIILAVGKTLVAALDWGLDVQSAIALPNMGSLNGPTLLERGSLYRQLGEELSRRGHSLEFAPLTSGLHGIERVRGGWRGAADPRRDGAAQGY